MSKRGPIKELRGEPPDEAHLAVPINLAGDNVALPPGAAIHVVTDPRRVDGIVRMVITQITPGAWYFRCGCGSPRCTVKYKFQAFREGTH